MQSLNDKSNVTDIGSHPKFVDSFELNDCCVRHLSDGLWVVVQTSTGKHLSKPLSLKSCMQLARELNHSAIMRRRLSELAEWAGRTA